MKQKILKGIRHRIEKLEQQLDVAFDSELNYILQDTNSKLDELYTLEEWILSIKEEE